MATHSSISSLLRESIPQFLEAANYCIKVPKNEQRDCLEFPGTALMFCIADAIGSFYRGNKSLKICVDNKIVTIKNDSFHHFYIFNSHYYSLALSDKVIQRLYKNYRNLLLHNALLSFGNALFISNHPKAVPFLPDEDKLHINVLSFLRITNVAAKLFLKNIENVVPGSVQESQILKKLRLTSRY